MGAQSGAERKLKTKRSEEVSRRSGHRKQGFVGHSLQGSSWGRRQRRQRLRCELSQRASARGTGTQQGMLRSECKSETGHTGARPPVAMQRVRRWPMVRVGTLGWDRDQDWKSGTAMEGAAIHLDTKPGSTGERGGFP